VHRLGQCPDIEPLRAIRLYIPDPPGGKVDLENMFILACRPLIYSSPEIHTKDPHPRPAKKTTGFVVERTTGTGQRPAVDIDFITDSLNHIKSMIDQDPQASREEITAFSQLLRNGYLKQK
jgi:hypothetical protein